MSTTTPKHPGGRPPKDPADKVVKCRISMTQAHHAATEGYRAGMIRRALELAPPKEFDYCIVGKVWSADFKISENGILEKLEIQFLGGATCVVRYPQKPNVFRPDDLLKIVYSNGEAEITNLSNPPTGDKQSKK